MQKLRLKIGLKKKVSVVPNNSFSSTQTYWAEHYVEREQKNMFPVHKNVNQVQRISY